MDRDFQTAQGAPHELKATLEALLLVSSNAVPATTFAKFLGVAPSEAASALAVLAAEYEDDNRGFQLREVVGGWRLFTHPAYHDVVEEYVLSWESHKLTQAALEVLAVVSYHQPVTREAIKSIRGVNSDGVISSLLQKGLICEVGREIRGRAQSTQFGTTKLFLEKFGLRSLAELPPLEDFAPNEESKQFIRDRLSYRTSLDSAAKVLEDIAEEDGLTDAYYHQTDPKDFDDAQIAPEDDLSLEDLVDDTEYSFDD